MIVLIFLVSIDCCMFFVEEVEVPDLIIYIYMYIATYEVILLVLV